MMEVGKEADGLQGPGKEEIGKGDSPSFKIML